jgi:hypothetical protein
MIWKRFLPHWMSMRRYHTYSGGGKRPDCEFCNEVVFFVMGTYFGYRIGKNE